MKITDSSDWRSGIPYDTPTLVADLVPGDPTRCAECGADSAPRDRSELWAVKHRHPNNHSGYVRFYCREHVPLFQRPKPVIEQRAARRPAARRAPAAVEHAPRAMCPDCFVEVSAAGTCPMCGNTVA
ncbi:MAG: glucose-6-phosphate dehydrogenase [Microbacterium pygmaeum]